MFGGLISSLVADYGFVIRVVGSLVLAILASPIEPIAKLALSTALTTMQALIELPVIFVCVSWPVGDNTHPGGFLCLVLPGTIVFGRDTGGAVSNDLLSGHQIILVDQVADVGPAEIVPAEMLQARLQLALFQDLDQRIRCQVSIFS